MAQRNSKIKALYKGYFNFNRETCIEYAYAYTPLQAKTIMMRRLAKKHDVSFFTVFNQFNGNKCNHEIMLEMEFKEQPEHIKPIMDRTIKKIKHQEAT